MTFSEEPLTSDALLESYRQIVSQHLPFLVAVDSSCGDVVGYANAHNFRGSKGAYRHTVEITLFCHPDHIGRGIGPQLLTALLNVLREPAKHTNLLIAASGEARVVKQVLAIMAVDETGKKSGLALKEFYEKAGFILVCPPKAAVFRAPRSLI